VRRFNSGRKHDLFRRVCVTVLTAMGAGLLLAPAQVQASEVSCQDLYVPVSVLGTPQTMYGKLCAPVGANTVQVLVPGGTYNSTYWDISYTPTIRSFRLAMNNAGYATLAVDRLGTGNSSKPPSVLLTASTQAGALHQVIQTLRAGTLGPRFDKVILGGHSLGSAISMIEAGTFHDVDGVLITGITHRIKLLNVGSVLANTTPAALDPQFAGRVPDPGYITTRPGTRYSAFHRPGPDIPGATAYDESTKDVSAVSEVVDTLLLTSVVIPYSRRIDVPVLLVVGDDPIVCGPPLGSDCSSAEALRQSEAPFYPPAAGLQTYVLHGYGHSINYAPNAPDYHQVVVQWADRTVGSSANCASSLAGDACPPTVATTTRQPVSDRPFPNGRCQQSGPLRQKAVRTFRRRARPALGGLTSLALGQSPYQDRARQSTIDTLQ